MTTFHQPIDRQIQTGVPLTGEVLVEGLEALPNRVQASLSELHDDSTSEFGACLAYTFGLPPEADDLVRQKLVESFSGVGEPSDNFTASEVIISGVLDTKPFRVFRQEAQIVLEDGSAPEGVVYSLLGTSVVATSAVVA